MSQPHPFHPTPTILFNKGRVEAFSDGVFGIAITLLILDVRIPDNFHGDFTWANFATQALPTLFPKLVSYLLSFIMVGIYWVAHHSMFMSFVGAIDRNFLWLNNALLLGVGFVPFSAGILGEHADTSLAQLIYGANLVAMGVLLLILLSYIVRTPAVRSPAINWHAVSLSRRRAGFALFAYALAMFLSFFQPRVSIAFFFVVPVLYLLPARFDGLWDIGHRHERFVERDEQQAS